MGALSYSVLIAAFGLLAIAYELRQIRLILSKNSLQPKTAESTRDGS